MFSFLLKLGIGVALFLAARYIGSIIKSRGETGRAKSDESFTSGIDMGLLKLVRVGASLFAFGFVVWALLGTSLVWVRGGHILTMNRVYFASSLQPGQIVAVDGQLGPQARIITAGLHFEPFITLFNEVKEVEVFTVPPGKCAIMSAKDGLPIAGGSAFAEPWAESLKHRMANDAEFFLSQKKDGGNGQRGPQATVIGPGSYTINPFLWEAPRIINATRVEQGTVGVVKSSILAEVDFGSFHKPKPTSTDLKVFTLDKLPKDSVKALLVPVGAIGVWEEPLPNGLYYINTDAYKMTMVPTTAQVNEYKGGYTKRLVEIWLNDDGKIEEKKTELVIQAVPTAADTAILAKPEGWDVWQELRVITQVSPEMAPYVVASLGLNEANAAQVIEDRVVTPIIRSVVRDILGGKQVPFVATKAVLDDKGHHVLDEAGKTKTELVRDFRPVRVLDLLENRSSIEDAIESDSRPEALKDGVSIMETRLSESAIPPELLLARKREQLAQQLKVALVQEQATQEQRKLTENARAQASQQETLVQADIKSQAAEKNKTARTTEGEGEKQFLLALAQGQKAQSEVLGVETTAKLQMFNQVMKTIADIADKHPEILVKGLENAHKFVPNVQVTGGSSGSNEAAAAIFGSLMGGNVLNQPKVDPKK